VRLKWLCGKRLQEGTNSVTSLSNTTGALANTYTFDTFGNLTASTGSTVNPLQYTGRDFDPETDLRYHRARYYSPDTGRFISEDPLGVGGDSMNFYRYAGNSPTMMIDPTGPLPLIYNGMISCRTSSPWWCYGHGATRRWADPGSAVLEQYFLTR
jgi:RHS repeat-associated protein